MGILPLLGIVFPAPAGINRFVGAGGRTGTGVPRASGDKPATVLVELKTPTVFPAPAGINRLRPDNQQRPWRVPRASGDKPKIADSMDNINTCSPRQRG
ncbi:hypothetical protein J9E33_001925 [Salmonella enterica]|nr:hypothetical protein [Salmonella enterica]EFO8527531.1 hypothetical protein [Salmonella enterica]EFR2316678.1 hypothetical protein [Salmonella enterica]EFR3850083.1 hypothetical protein [Salmonella enterica]EGG4277470.1 hypothetical protein [Salmonella enterica]